MIFLEPQSSVSSQVLCMLVRLNFNQSLSALNQLDCAQFVPWCSVLAPTDLDFFEKIFCVCAFICVKCFIKSYHRKRYLLKLVYVLQCCDNNKNVVY
jgi:hypothetical protein